MLWTLRQIYFEENLMDVHSVYYNIILDKVAFDWLELLLCI
jgi:hypothetical protein